MRTIALAAALAAASCGETDVKRVGMSSHDPDALHTLVRAGQQVKLDAVVISAISDDPLYGTPLEWRSDSPHVSVDQTGVVTAVSDGDAHVFASLHGVDSPPWPFTVHFATAGGPISIVANIGGLTGDAQLMVSP